MFDYTAAEVEAWRGLLSGVLPALVLALYAVSTLVLSVYSIYYIASVAAYMERPVQRPRGGPGVAGVLYRVAWGERLSFPHPAGWPRVAVVYPVYNDYEVLSSVEKALRMDYPDYFVLVVDDSSDPGLSRELSNLALRSERLLHLRRFGRRGLKAGALNDAVRVAESLGARYVLVLDADFEPPPWLLRALVSYAEESGVDVVQGHQRHVKGATGVFGRLYRASMAGAAVMMAGRERLGLFPIFTGSVGLIRVESALETPFVEGSLSEDLRWTIDRLVAVKGRVVMVVPPAYADGSVPVDLGAFYRQQVRWSEGTLRELLATWGDVLLDPAVPFKEKLGYLLQGLFYTQGFWVYANTLAPFAYTLLTGTPVPLLWLFGVYFWFMGIETVIIAGGIQERLGARTTLLVALSAIPYIYVTAAIHSIGSLRALLSRSAGWAVTPKRGEHVEEYRLRGE